MPVESISPASSGASVVHPNPERKHPVLFEKFVVHKDKDGQPVDDKGKPINFKALNLTGCIAFSRDPKHKGLVHFLVWVIQKIHHFFLRRSGMDLNMCHGMIVLGHDPKDEVLTIIGSHRRVTGFERVLRKICAFFRKIHDFLFGKSSSKTLSAPKIIDRRNKLILAHVVDNGARTGNRNYLLDEDCQSIVFYRPLEEKMKKFLIDYAYQTAYTPERFRTDEQKGRPMCKKQAPFSYHDLFLSFFHNSISPNKMKMTHRKAFMLADLLLGDQIKDRKNRPKSLFCTPYVISVLQGAQFMQDMPEEERKRLLFDGDKARSRKALAEFIYKDMAKNKESHLRKVFEQNKVARICARYTPSGVFCKYLDKFSVEIAPST